MEPQASNASELFILQYTSIYSLQALPTPDLSLISAFLTCPKTGQLPSLVYPALDLKNGQGAVIYAICLTIPFILFYIARWAVYLAQRSSREPSRVPPTVPYMVPYLGAVFSFVLNPAKCLEATVQVVGPQATYGLKVLNNTLYFLNGPENVARIWKYKSVITTPNVQTFVLINVFGMARKAVKMYTLDNSGIQPDLIQGSDVAPHNRIDYLTHAGFHKLLNGVHLPNFYRRWSSSFVRRLECLCIGSEWTEVPDIMHFWEGPLTASLNEAFAGPVLEKLNPHFTDNFNKFLPYVHGMMMGLPRWCMPKAHKLRDGLNEDVRQWHALARAQFKESDIAEDGDTDPWWGSTAIRERQKILGNVENWDYDSIAASDFGLLWGANINVHTAAIWTIVEVFRDSSLLYRVRAELAAANVTDITSPEDIEKILCLPLLQSVHSEVLRLRVEVQSVFTSEKEEIRINEWRFPKKSLVLVPTGPAHRDPNFWNTRDGQFPLDTFWADRFLAYPNDPRSGPIRKSEAAVAKASRKQTQDNTPKYISAGMNDSFMPYGVGERTCPGRFFARREIVAFCAKVVNELDIEITSTEKEFAISPAFYGLGTQRPLKNIPFRVRRRKVEC
ncbi:hypothetical protein MMC18_000634 [Xylographa bjoerkii]|nr:hypothetical protein [Xylographa bjoerkii]